MPTCFDLAELDIRQSATSGRTRHLAGLDIVAPCSERGERGLSYTPCLSKAGLQSAPWLGNTS